MPIHLFALSPDYIRKGHFSSFGWWQVQLVAEAPPLPPYLPSPFPVLTRGMASSVWWSYQLLQGCLLPLFCCGWRHMTNLTARNQTQIFLKRCSSGDQISISPPSSEWLGVLDFSYRDFLSFILPCPLPLVPLSLAYLKWFTLGNSNGGINSDESSRTIGSVLGRGAQFLTVFVSCNFFSFPCPTFTF